MSFRNNEDWDLCWHYLSSTGCKNSDCTWRHDNSVGKFYQKNVQKTRGKGISFRGDPRKTRGAPFYPIKQHQDGGVEDQYGLIHYPDMDKKDACLKSFRRKLGYHQEYEHTRPFSSPMSVSSSVKTSAPTSISASMITSQGASDSEGDMVKNDMVVPTRNFDKFQKRNSCVFSDFLYGEVKTPRRRRKKEWLSGIGNKSSFSPFAKVFVPQNSVMSKDGIGAGLNEITLENFAVDTIQQRTTLKSCLTENDKVFE